MKQDLYTQLVWDYNITKEEFETILSGEAKRGTFDQDWAVSRVLTNLHYYDAMSLVPYTVLKQRWPHIKGKIFIKSIKDSYEFLLQRYPVSIAG
jgi:hypothetical protein